MGRKVKKPAVQALLIHVILSVVFVMRCYSFFRRRLAYLD